MPVTLQFSLGQALKEGMARLNAASVPSSALSAELLLIHATGRDRTGLYAHPEEALDNSLVEKYLAMIARRASGEPTQYIVGKQEFWGLEFEVTPAVLIPRPETEHLIEVALGRIGAARRTEGLRIADVGTGSGCIAVALAQELPNVQITATDISSAALEVARRNVARHEMTDRIQLVLADLLAFDFHESRAKSQQPRLFDLILSNPPYIATGEAPELQREVRDYEPAQALFAGPAGSEIYERLIEQAWPALKPGGILAMELGYGLAEPVGKMFDPARWSHLSTSNDLAGLSRVIAAERM
jgi:release factor glutamine methyltransferase